MAENKKEIEIEDNCPNWYYWCIMNEVRNEFIKILELNGEQKQ